MAGTIAAAALLEVVQDSLLTASCIYQAGRGGDLRFNGVRPDGGWMAHGYFMRLLWMLCDGKLVRRRLWKHRWLHADGHTCHSRPPEDIPSLGFCSLIVVLKLWSWLDGDRGIHHCDDVLPELQGHVDARTVERWLRRAIPHAQRLQQVMRRAVMERCEPRPIERLFPTGLSPPQCLLRRRWRDPLAVEVLWRALAVILVGAVELSIPASLLLAEARGRCGTLERQSLI